MRLDGRSIVPWWHHWDIFMFPNVGSVPLHQQGRQFHRLCFSQHDAGDPEWPFKYVSRLNPLDVPQNSLWLQKKHFSFNYQKCTLFKTATVILTKRERASVSLCVSSSTSRLTFFGTIKAGFPLLCENPTICCSPPRACCALQLKWGDCSGSWKGCLDHPLILLMTEGPPSLGGCLRVTLWVMTVCWATDSSSRHSN